jgi:hypothetical protein
MGHLTEPRGIIVRLAEEVVALSSRKGSDRINWRASHTNFIYEREATLLQERGLAVLRRLSNHCLWTVWVFTVGNLQAPAGQISRVWFLYRG